MDVWLAAVTAGIVNTVPQDEVHIRSTTDFPERSLDDIKAERERIRLEEERIRLEEERKVKEEEARKADEETRRQEALRPREEDPEGESTLPKDPREGPSPVPSQTQTSRPYIRTRAPNKSEKKVSFQRIENGLAKTVTMPG